MMSFEGINDDQKPSSKFGVATSTSNHINHLKSCHDVDIQFSNPRKRAVTCQALSTKTGNTQFNHARRLAEMCCVDLQPFNIVEREGFQRYAKRLCPEIKFPCSKTVGTTALNDVYDVYLLAVKKLLENCPNDVTLVLDMWTDRYKKVSYINIKLHYSKAFKLICVSLKTEQFPHPHTGKIIGEKIMSTLKDFGLQHKNITAVTDAGSNIISALKLKKIERFPCLAHTLHRFISHDILGNMLFEKIDSIITKLKKIFRALTFRAEDIQHFQHLKESEQVYETLQNIYNCVQMDENFVMGNLENELENALQTPHYTSLKNSVPTRWNSLLKMVKSFEENVESINVTLIKINLEDLVIPAMEREIIKEFREFLDIFSEATIYLQGQNYATISTWIYFFENIYSKLVEKENLATFEIIIYLYGFAKQKFFKRFSLQKLHVIAALMDPCQKNWKTLTNYVEKIPELPNILDTFVLELNVQNPTTNLNLICNAIRRHNIGQRPSDTSCGEPALKKEKISGSRKKMLEFVSWSGNGCANDSLTSEVQKYLDIAVSDAESLDWWKEHKMVFPRVAELANIYFGIPATSASSEMAFSVAGSCITEKRSRLNPSTVKKQLFVHDNYKLVKELI